MIDPRAITTEALVSHAPWARKLARRSASDPGLAADPVKDTWLEVVENPPRSGANPRGWLNTVLRRRLCRRTREESSRQRRKAGAAPPDEERPDVLLARLVAHQQHSARVHALSDPHRSVVLMPG